MQTETENQSTSEGTMNNEEDDIKLNNLQSLSLQDSFKKFRDQKIRERETLKLCKQNSGISRSNDFKESLRLKFIEGAKKYIGIPYGEKYKEDGAPIAPLYLDCCGLVRQVVLDLQEEFGFLIGKFKDLTSSNTLTNKTFMNQVNGINAIKWIHCQ